MILTLTLAQLAQLAALWTERPVLARRGLCETFSLQYPKDMTPPEGEALLRATLRAHRYQLVDRGRALYIDGEPASPCRPRYADVRTLLVRAKAGTLSEVEDRALRLMSAEGTVEFVGERGALILSDRADVIREMEEWLEEGAD